MHKAETDWIVSRLAGVDPAALSPMLNIGSSTLEFRTKKQPWIEANLIKPLEARGVKIVHADLKSGPGVDITADLTTDDGFKTLAAVGARSIMICNVLEHVLDPRAFANRCLDLVQPDGFAIVTVPHSYPYHRDPIDTMYRPTPEEAASLFDETVVVARDIIDAGSYRDHVKARPWIISRQIFRAPFPFLGWEKWKRSMGKLYWLVYPYQMTCVLLRKTG
ncbi:MAG: hypothetical protein KBA31_19990 [Alphaproteobacteria bacterium]|nr:hypothetical protein [Alphaproteobacteria bacterium]